MRLSLVQYSPVWEDKKSNMEHLSRLTAEAGETDLLMFPEMTLIGFTMKSDKFSEELRGESYNFFASSAKDKKCYIAAGIIEREGNRYYNTLILINREGKLAGSYRKIHPFSYSSENIHYTGGDRPVVIDIDGWKTGLSICYDLRFPELYREYGKQRVSLILNIANWPDTRIHHWNALLKARAIENQCYIAGVNRTGIGHKLNYPGAGAVYDPMGDEILYCGSGEGVFNVDIEIEEVESVRTKFPFLNDIKLI